MLSDSPKKFKNNNDVFGFMLLNHLTALSDFAKKSHGAS